MDEPVAENEPQNPVRSLCCASSHSDWYQVGEEEWDQGWGQGPWSPTRQEQGPVPWLLLESDQTEIRLVSHMLVLFLFFCVLPLCCRARSE